MSLRMTPRRHIEAITNFIVKHLSIYFRDQTRKLFSFDKRPLIVKTGQKYLTLNFHGFRMCASLASEKNMNK